MLGRELSGLFSRATPVYRTITHVRTDTSPTIMRPAGVQSSLKGKCDGRLMVIQHDSRAIHVLTVDDQATSAPYPGHSVIAKPPSFFTRFVVVPGLRTGDASETVRPRVYDSFLCGNGSALRQGRMFLSYDAPARYGNFKSISSESLPGEACTYQRANVIAGQMTLLPNSLPRLECP